MANTKPLLYVKYALSAIGLPALYIYIYISQIESQVFKWRYGRTTFVLPSMDSLECSQ